MTLKRYLAFCGWIYYPDGGINDFIGDFDGIEEASLAIESRLDEDRDVGVWGQIWDSKTRCLVWQKKYDATQDLSFKI